MRELQKRGRRQRLQVPGFLVSRFRWLLRRHHVRQLSHRGGFVAGWLHREQRGSEFEDFLEEVGFIGIEDCLHDRLPCGRRQQEGAAVEVH